MFLKRICECNLIIKKLIGAEGARPRRSDSDEEAHRPPHGKRATWSGNQLVVHKVYENSLTKISKKCSLYN